jgi:hypothetical protein
VQGFARASITNPSEEYNNEYGSIIAFWDAASGSNVGFQDQESMEFANMVYHEFREGNLGGIPLVDMINVVLSHADHLYPLEYACLSCL